MPLTILKNQSNKKNFILPFVLLLNSVLFSCTENKNNSVVTTTDNQQFNTMDTATFGAGCFWCVEAQFQILEGVLKVTSGYSGGKNSNPSYEAVCSGTTGHAEVIQIIYDPSIIKYEELLEAFWQTHDPTQLNRQGNDIGSQYRSVIFYHNETQKQLALKYKNELNSSKIWLNPIVTEISQLVDFFPAENYHQNYFNENPNQSYCQFVIVPKLEKFKKVFQSKLKGN